LIIAGRNDALDRAVALLWVGPAPATASSVFSTTTLTDSRDGFAGARSVIFVMDVYTIVLSCRYT
jgi:hypothetical protein